MVKIILNMFNSTTDVYKDISTYPVPRAASHALNAGEGCIIFFIMVVWFVTLITFVHKWRHIRILQPREPRFKHSPKNLETIKVVERPTDSVIYKSYTRQISDIMQARQKKLDRMQRTQSRFRERQHHPYKLRHNFVRSRFSTSLTRPLLKLCEMTTPSDQSQISQPLNNVAVFLTTAEEEENNTTNISAQSHYTCTDLIQPVCDDENKEYPSKAYLSVAEEISEQISI